MHFFWPTSPSHLCVKLLRRVKVDRLSIYSSGIERAQASVSPPVQMNTDLSTTAHVLSLSLALSTKPTPPLIYRRPGRTQPAGCTMPRRPAWPAAPCSFHFRRYTTVIAPQSAGGRTRTAAVAATAASASRTSAASFVSAACSSSSRSASAAGPCVSSPLRQPLP